MSATWTVPEDLYLPELPAGAPAPGEPIQGHLPHCFGCGVDLPQNIGLKLRLYRGEEGVSAYGRSPVNTYHEGWPGVFHGGIIMASLDETMGAIGNLLHVPIMTAHMQSDFRRPLPVAEGVEFRARLVGQKGRKLYIDSGAYVGEDPEPFIQARALFVVLSLEQAVQQAGNKLGNATSGGA